MTEFLSRNLAGLVPSDIRLMTRECQRIGGINMGQGVCDLPTPPLVRDGAIAAIEARRSTYSYAEGARELREAIASKLKRDNGIDADPETQIVVTIGSTGAFTTAIVGLLNPGDGILIPEPYYGYHLNSAVLAGLEPQFLSLEPPEFPFTEDGLRSAIRENTRAIVICTPSNPSGKMFSADELAVLERVACEKDLLVITDEIYEYIRYDGRRHISPATVGDLAERTVTLMGLSKTFSITGWRLGYATAPTALAQRMTMVNDIYYVCAPTPLQYGAAAGFAVGSAFFEDLARSYQKKRDLFCAALRDAGFDPIVPQGAYYVLADVSAHGFEKARTAAMAILEQVGVACIPGTSFFQGSTGESLVRFCFATEDSVLEEACRRIRSFRAG